MNDYIYICILLNYGKTHLFSNYKSSICIDFRNKSNIKQYKTSTINWYRIDHNFSFQHPIVTREFLGRVNDIKMQ
jgi:hypothetical protein